jgi:hypothetical protein
LKPGWGSPLVQEEKNQEKPVKKEEIINNKNNTALCNRHYKRHKTLYSEQGAIAQDKDAIFTSGRNVVKKISCGYLEIRGTHDRSTPHVGCTIKYTSFNVTHETSVTKTFMFSNKLFY